MNNSPNRLGPRLAVAIALLACGAVAALLFAERSKHANALDELRREAAELRAQLEASDGVVSSLRAEVQLLRGSALPAGTTAVSAVDLQLARRVSDLALQQSNLSVAVERLLARPSDAPAPVASAQRREAAYAALEAAAQEEQRKLETATQKATDLLFNLGIPAEVSTMDADKALDTASLRAYWPFFEAKRERDSLRSLAQRLQMRLAQERLEARLEAAK